MKSRLYFIILFLLPAAVAAIGTTFDLGKKYWIWAGGGLVLYIWCKDVFTGTKWFAKKKNSEQEPVQLRQKSASLPYEDYGAALLDLNDREKEGYLELTRLCVSPNKQQKLFDFFNAPKDFSKDADYSTTLNYVMDYSDDHEIHFLMALDWKAAIEDLEWRLTASLKDNYGLTIGLPKQQDYGERASVSFDTVFEDFDKPLRKSGFQIGFIDTQSDEYVLLVHKVADKQSVQKSIEKIGYAYYEK